MSVPLNLHRWRPRLTDVAARPEAPTAERTMEFDDFSVITYEAGMFALRTVTSCFGIPAARMLTTVFLN